MSLINDALKKAREEDAARNSPNPPRAAREEPAPSQGKLVALALTMGGVIIILLAVIIAALVQLFRASTGKTPPVEPAQPVAGAPALPEAKQAPAVLPQPSVTTVADLPAAPNSVAEAPRVEVTVSQAPEGKTPPSVAAAPSASLSVPEAPKPSGEAVPSPVPADAPTVEQPAVSAEPSTPPVPAAPKADLPDQRIAEFVQAIEVRGMGPRKVLLALPGVTEARAYVAGDAIDCPYNLTLVSLDPRKLVFEDGDGHKYNKPL